MKRIVVYRNNPCHVELQFVDRSLGNPLPVNNATEKKFVFQKPSGITTEYDALNLSDGLDGWMQYDVAANILDTNGDWYVHARVDGIDSDPIILQVKDAPKA